MILSLLLACSTAPAPSPEAPAAPPPPAPELPPEPAPELPPEPEPEPTFSAQIVEIPEAVRAEMAGVSMHEGCPVGFDALRLITMTYRDFEGAIQEGELVVAAAHAEGVAGAFEAMFEAGFQIERMERVDAYGGSDDASMAANNTSAFNCRAKTGGTSFSRHSYGDAIDVNPLTNPYIVNPRAPAESQKVSPPEGRAHLDRTRAAPGLIQEGGAAVAAFDALGWGWGGRWSRAVDYQHFSSNGE